MSLIYLPSIQGLDAVSFLTLAAVGAVPNANGASISSDQVLTLQPANTSFPGVLTAADWNTFNNKQAAGNYITALTGDGTASGPGSAALTLATVNSNVGSFGSSTSIPSFTVDAKGRITAASGNAVIAPAGTLTGTTLASNVVTSSLTSVGTIATGTWQGTAVDATHGGTAQTTFTLGDILYSSATNTLAKLAGNTSASKKFLSQTGTGSVSAAPVWDNAPTPTYTAPTVQKFTSGSGTYTLPANVLYIRVQMVGAGGGGSGGGDSAGTGGTGGNTTFGTTLLVANGGVGGVWEGTLGGAGGTASLGSGPVGAALPGGAGSANGFTSGLTLYMPGAPGGSSAWGGQGGGGGISHAGGAGGTNTGGGGGGGGFDAGANRAGGDGGGAGGFVDAIITSPSSTYSYAVGAAGTAGTAGGSGFAGGAGGSGLIIVTEYYQ